MAVQRRTDVLLDSVTRLLRVGAPANLLNLLQKQHPTDVAEILTRLPPHYRRIAAAGVFTYSITWARPDRAPSAASRSIC